MFGNEDFNDANPIGSGQRARVYLDQFDKEMERYVKLSQIRDLDFKFLRFVDDIFLMTKNKKAIEVYTSRALQVLEELGFKARVQIRHVNEGVDVLGFTIRRWSICPSNKSLDKLRDRLIRLICESLELKNEVSDVYYTNVQADNANTSTTDQYHQLKNGWTNHYGQDAWTNATRQWRTLVTWITMIEKSGVISSQTTNVSTKPHHELNIFHIHSHASTISLLIKELAYALKVIVNDVMNWLYSSLYRLFSVKRSNEALRQELLTIRR